MGYNQRRTAYFPKYSAWIFCLTLFILGLLYNYHEILFFAPQSLHQWRQCDCLSITLNYCQDKNGFFQPAVHYLGVDGTGKTVSDFPLIYYFVGQLWKIFGQHEYVYRLINLTIFLFGMIALFKTIETILKDSVLSLIFCSLLFTSPILVFYANNFLMDVPALSFSFIGIYFFVKYYYKNNFKHLIYFGLSFLICGLLKVSSLVSFIALFGVFILESLGVWRSEISKIFPSGLKAWLVFSVVFSLIIIWYLYAYDYNRRHTGSIFLVGILPAWNMDKNQLANAFQSLWNQIRTDYFLFETQLVWAAMLLYSCIFYRKGSRKLQIFTWVVLAGVLGYVVLFFQAVSGHDYYVLNMLVAVPAIILCFLKTFQRQYKHIYYSFIFRIILVIFLIHNIDFATRRLHDRYNINGWQNENYIKNVKVFEEISPYLETIGVARDDKVISLSDNSINITLYLMNRKGWTNYGISGDCAKIREKIGLGAKFIIVYNQQTFENPAIQEFLYNEIGVYKTVHIYKL